MAVIVALVRDMGPGAVMQALQLELEARGHTVCLLVEAYGKAAGILPHCPQANTEQDLQALQHADVAIAGLSTPRVLEAVFDQKARGLNVPLVYIEDYWGCYVRSPYTPDLYLTLDKQAKKLLVAARPGAAAAIVGFTGIAPVDPPQELRQVFDDIRAGCKGTKILVYPDAGPMCQCTLPRLVESILESAMPIVLVPKIHPKFGSVPHPSGSGTWNSWCEEELQPLRYAKLLLERPEPTDQLVEAADGVASCYSTLLMRPATSGRLALTLWDEFAKLQLHYETGLEKTPLMLDGRFAVLAGVTPLDRLLDAEQPRYSLQAFDPKAAADAVLSLV